jgi:integrase
MSLHDSLKLNTPPGRIVIYVLGAMAPSPIAGPPYEPGNLQQKVIRKAGDRLGIPNLGFHTFRHMDRSMLDASGAPVGVQPRLMRHCSGVHHDEHL